MNNNNNNRTQTYQYDHSTSGLDEWSPSTRQPSKTMTIKQGNEKPKLLSIQPSQGQEGSMVTLTLCDLPCQFTYRLAFNSLMVETRQLQSEQQNELTYSGTTATVTTTTTLAATIPSFQMTMSTTPIVPISVCFLNNKDIIQDTCFVANFTYQSNYENSNESQQQEQRKRRYSITDDAISSSPSKRICNQDLQYQPTSCASSVTFPSYEDMQYSTYIQQQQRGRNELKPSMSLQFQHQRQDNTLPTIMESPYNEMQQYYLPQQSPYGLQTSESASRQSSPPQRRKSLSQRASLPILKSTSHQASTTVANYQPYPGQVDQNNFELVDDLDTMMHNWTVTEQQQGRRLVRFWCKEDTNQQIRCGCHPVTQNDPVATDATHTVVSCIYWPERDEYYITSVDCIYLLESLLRTHFGVEEKNRIRRNLEGFRPVTVAKAKPASAEFFKRVMGFPHPKPRNIEKDIKAFHWKILPYAIKKIVTKYAMESAARQLPPTAVTTTNSSLPDVYSTSLVPQSYTMFPPSLHSRTTSLGSEATNVSSSTSSSSSSSSTSLSLPTPPTVSDDDAMTHHYQHYQYQNPPTKQPLYYNPSTMTYGDHQEPGVRFVPASSPSTSVPTSPASPHVSNPETLCDNYLPPSSSSSSSSSSTTAQVFHTTTTSGTMMMSHPIFDESSTTTAPFVSSMFMTPYQLM